MQDPLTLSEEARRAANWHTFQALVAECEGNAPLAEVHLAAAKREGLIVETLDEVAAARRGWL